MAFKVINNEVITDSSVLQNTTIDESNVLDNVFNVTDGTTSHQVNRGDTITFTAGAGVTITQLNGTVTISSDAEGIEDLISPLLVHSNHTYIDATYDDINDQVLLAVNITTDGVTEGSTNLYYTDTRADARIALQTGIYLDLSAKDTDDLVEGTTNLYYTDERVDDRVSNLLVAGTNVTLTYNDVANTLTINSTDTNTTYSNGSGIDLTGTVFSHSDTSTQSSLTALVGADVVSDIDVDGFGHVTSLATRTMTLNDLGYTGATNADYYYGWNLHVAGVDRGDVLSSETIDFVAGGGIDLTYSTTNDNTITISHTDTSSAVDLSASSRRYVSGLTFDTYGHVTGYTTGTETVTDTNNYVSSLAFNTGDGVLTANRSGLTALTVDLDGRYLLSSDYVDTYITTAAFNTTDGVLTLTRNDAATVTVDLDGRYLESYTETQTLQDVTDLGATTTNAISITNATGSTSDTTGALTVSGGVGIAENLYVNGTINGGEVNLSYTDFAGIAFTSAPAYQEGRMYYDTDAKTLVLYGNDSNFDMPVGEREWVRVRNSSGATILKGQPVYATGVHIAGHPIHGHHPTVALADASDVNKIEVLGLAAHDIADTAHGYVIVRGYIDNINTSTLTTGSRVHLGFASPGTIIDNAPGYPNYPVDLGLALTSDASTGTIYVDIQTHTFEELRLTNNGRVDGNWTVGGNLTVNGTTSIIGTTNLAVSNNFIYLNSGDTIGEANTLFTGSGLDDGSLNGHYTGTTTKTFYVRIDSVGGGTGGVDTFEWSIDNFSTTVATGIDVSTSPTSLSDNITVMWEATTGHTLNATWYGTAAPSNVDNAIIGNRNTGATGVGYTHIGLFFDVSDEKWKLFSEYDPEPTGSINIADASFNLGTLAAGAFEGNLTGDVTGNVTGNLSGNATSADKWSTGRTLTLSGDVTGTSAAFDGSGNISISTTIAANSVALGTDTTGNYAGSITAGGGITVTGAAGEGTAYTVAHTDTSTAANLSATSRTYVNSLTFDTYGHVTAYGTATETVVDTNNYVSGVSFNTADGILTLTRAGLGNLTVDLDGRYLTSASDTTYSISSETGTGGANLRLTGSDASTDDVLIAGGANVTVTRTDANTITIAATDTNTTYSAGSGLTLAGTTFSHTDTSSAANLTASGRTYVTGLTFDTYGHVTGYSTGTETVTDTNTTYTAGTGLSLVGTTFSNAAPDQTVTLTGSGATSISGTYPNFTISSTDTNTTYSAATSTVAGLIELASDTVQSVAANAVSATASRTYGVQVNSSGQAVVNVPWVDTNTTYSVATTSADGLMSSTDKSKLDGIEAGATGDQTAAEILALLVTVDGAGSGLDADTVDGLSSAAFLRANANDSATGIITLTNATATTSAATGALVISTGGLGVGGSIYAGGDVTAYSDERLKDNIVTITDAVSKVDQLRGVTYTRKSDSIASTGVIAQDVEKVLPQAVATDEDGMMSVKYGNMVGLLIEAIKEQNETIKVMQAEIAELKARLNS